MANIIYAASSEGFGHAVRAHAVGAGLLARGHDVQFVSSGCTIRYLREHFPDRLHEVLGLMLIFGEKGSLSVLRTIGHNVYRMWELFPSQRRLDALMHKFQPDLVITDFEPFSAHAAWRCGVPFISLDNQHLLTHCKLRLPSGHSADAINAYLTIRLYYANARRYLIPTFIPAVVRHHPTTLVDPILRPHVYSRHATEGKFLLAYKTGALGGVGILEAIRKADRMPIRAYGFGIVGQERHISFHQLSTDAFLDDLSSCAGVIASAGHSLISECLYFRKPMLLLPLAGQFEQAINAFHVERLGAGRVARVLDRSAIDAFIGELAELRLSMRSIRKPSLDSVLDAVEQEIPALRRHVLSAELHKLPRSFRYAI
ncbi:MAG: hypothetical protein HY287_10280 [Planctomycetes bacterium]|nr:hypothetical protein [Planctomycetota bacterium]MBI3834703.1 hypothetical protein [Planctomycetota bacterium]